MSSPKDLGKPIPKLELQAYCCPLPKTWASGPVHKSPHLSFPKDPGFRACGHLSHPKDLGFKACAHLPCCCPLLKIWALGPMHNCLIAALRKRLGFRACAHLPHCFPFPKTQSSGSLHTCPIARLSRNTWASGPVHTCLTIANPEDQGFEVCAHLSSCHPLPGIWGTHTHPFPKDLSSTTRTHLSHHFHLPMA